VQVVTDAVDRRPPGPRDWKIDYTFDDTEVHVRPRNDHVFHTLSDDCVCGPETMPKLPGDLRWLIVHHPLDGRQAVKVTQV
jgi:hypothetical protein